MAKIAGKASAARTRKENSRKRDMKRSAVSSQRSGRKSPRNKKTTRTALPSVLLDIIDELGELEDLLRLVPELRRFARYMDEVFSSGSEPPTKPRFDRIRCAADKAGISDEAWQHEQDSQPSMPGDEDTGQLWTMLDAIVAAIRLRLSRTVRLIELVK